MTTYYERNKERIKESEKHKKQEYYLKNKEKISLRSHEYYKENKANMKQKQLEYYECKKDQLKEKALEYYYDNKVTVIERMREYNKQYWEKNKEKISQKRKWKYGTICPAKMEPTIGMTICKDITLYFK